MTDAATLAPPVDLQDFDDHFDPFTAFLEINGERAVVDPYTKLSELRRQSPVVPVDMHEVFGLTRQVTIGDRPVFMVLGYDAVNEALNMPDRYINAVYKTNLGLTFGRTVTAMDGAEHTRHRRLFQSAFTPKMLDSLRPRFQAVIDRLVARFEQRKSADLVGEFAMHFPFEFIMDLMGMPQDPVKRKLYHKIAAAQTCVAFDRDHGVRAAKMLGDFLEPLINQRRELHSDTDFVSVIANAEIEGERLEQEVVVSFFRQLMNAGGDTSFHGFSNVLTALFTHPDQLEAVRRDRSLIPLAIDEALRWQAPVLCLAREPSQDVKLAGVDVPAGAYLHVAVGAANRDPSVFVDPDKFNIFRPVKRHVAFGFGPHVCIGQHLARMELTMALNTLLDRLPNVRLDADFPAPEICGVLMRGAEHVHVRWD